MPGTGTRTYPIYRARCFQITANSSVPKVERHSITGIVTTKYVIYKQGRHFQVHSLRDRFATARAAAICSTDRCPLRRKRIKLQKTTTRPRDGINIRPGTRDSPSVMAMSISWRSSSLRMEERKPSVVWFISDVEFWNERTAVSLIRRGRGERPVQYLIIHDVVRVFHLEDGTGIGDGFAAVGEVH